MADSEGSAPSSASCSLLEMERGRKDRGSLTATCRRTAQLHSWHPGTVMGAQLNPRGGQGGGLNSPAQDTPGKVSHTVSQTQLRLPKELWWYLKVTACFPRWGRLSLLDMVTSIPSPSSTSWTQSRGTPFSIPVPFPSAPSSRDRSCP